MTVEADIRECVLATEGDAYEEQMNAADWREDCKLLLALLGKERNAAQSVLLDRENLRSDVEGLVTERDEVMEERDDWSAIAGNQERVLRRVLLLDLGVPRAATSEQWRGAIAAIVKVLPAVQCPSACINGVRYPGHRDPIRCNTCAGRGWVVDKVWQARLEQPRVGAA